MKSKYYIKFYQKPGSSASPQTQAPKGLERLNSILEGMGDVAPGCAIGYIKTEGGAK